MEPVSINGAEQCSSPCLSHHLARCALAWNISAAENAVDATEAEGSMIQMKTIWLTFRCSVDQKNSKIGIINRIKIRIQIFK